MFLLIYKSNWDDSVNFLVFLWDDSKKTFFYNLIHCSWEIYNFLRINKFYDLTMINLLSSNISEHSIPGSIIKLPFAWLGCFTKVVRLIKHYLPLSCIDSREVEFGFEDHFDHLTHLPNKTCPFHMGKSLNSVPSHIGHSAFRMN
jgi:hypothetical protein